MRLSEIGAGPRVRQMLVVALATSCLGAPAAAGPVSDADLVAHWDFQEGAGTSVKDVSGNGAEGAIVTPPQSEARWGCGGVAQALSIAGGAHILVQPSNSLNALKRRITIAVAIEPRTLWPLSLPQRIWGKAKALLGIGSARKGDRGFIAVVQRQWREAKHPDLFYLGYGWEKDTLNYKWHVGLVGAEPGLYRLPEGEKAPPLGKWVHLAGVYDGESGAMALYVDGKPIGSETIVGEMRIDPESLNRPLIIGGELNSASIDDVENAFDGCIADARIYARALSADEIQELAAEAGTRLAR